MDDIKLIWDNLSTKYEMPDLDSFRQSLLGDPEQRDIAYKELSTISLVYGGGFQLSLFEVERGVFKGFYSSLSGAYLSVDVEYEFDSSAGNKWNKEAEFKELSVKGELGIIRSWFAVYLGGVFLKYDETTRREQLTGLGSFT